MVEQSGFTTRSESIRSMARSLIPGFLERGLSANEALRTLREQGLGYRRQDFLADYRGEKERYDQAIKVRFVNELNTPSEKILQPKYWGVPDRYSFTFEVNGYDPEAQVEVTQYIMYHRNSLVPRAIMEAEAEEYVKSSGDRYAINVFGVRIMAGYINPVWA
jgi:hypothetical protein